MIVYKRREKCSRPNARNVFHFLFVYIILSLLLCYVYIHIVYILLRQAGGHLPGPSRVPCIGSWVTVRLLLNMYIYIFTIYERMCSTTRYTSVLYTLYICICMCSYVHFMHNFSLFYLFFLCFPFCSFFFILFFFVCIFLFYFIHFLYIFIIIYLWFIVGRRNYL